jgi:tryptophan-rich sensory protein
MKTTIISVGAVVATAAIGAVAADPGSAWYRSLRKPRWQPPPPAYALVWTPLYATIAYAAATALTRAQSRDRSQLAGSLILDLALNAAWTPLFFRGRRPPAALAEIACLNIANALLIRQTWRADRAAAVLLLPYASWTAFATALNAEIVRLNPGA